MDVDDMDDLDDLDDMGINMDGQVHLDDFRIHIMGPCDSFLISQVSDEDRVSDDDDKTDHLENYFSYFFRSVQSRPRLRPTHEHPSDFPHPLFFKQDDSRPDQNVCYFQKQTNKDQMIMCLIFKNKGLAALPSSSTSRGQRWLSLRCSRT